MAGHGNIYVDEVLFASRTNPETRGDQIDQKTISKILENSKNILELAIAKKGTTKSTFASKIINGEEVKGGFQNFLKVHTKKDFPCPNCKTKIIKIKVNGRGTYFCPECQKK